MTTTEAPRRTARIEGVLETALYVADLDRATAFYQGVLGLGRLFGDDRLVALDAGRPGSVLLLFRRGTTLDTVRMPGGTIPPHDGHGPVHVAFAVSETALAEATEVFGEAGIAVEGRTAWPRGGRSLYVRDPDGHLVELATPGLWPTY